MIRFALALAAVVALSAPAWVASPSLAAVAACDAGAGNTECDRLDYDEQTPEPSGEHDADGSGGSEPTNGGSNGGGGSDPGSNPE